MATRRKKSKSEGNNSGDGKNTLPANPRIKEYLSSLLELNKLQTTLLGQLQKEVSQTSLLQQ